MTPIRSTTKNYIMPTTHSVIMRISQLKVSIVRRYSKKRNQMQRAAHVWIVQNDV